jgi:hypothetical protein
MNDQDAWAPAPWLPVRVQRQIAAINVADDHEAREAETQRAANAEARLQEDLGQWQMAHGDLTVLELEQLKAKAETLKKKDRDRMAAEAAQVFLSEMFAQLKAKDEREKELNLVGSVQTEHLSSLSPEPVIHQPVQQRGAIGLAMANMRRHFNDRQAARRAAQTADNHLADYGLVSGVSTRPRPDPLIDGTVRR